MNTTLKVITASLVMMVTANTFASDYSDKLLTAIESKNVSLVDSLVSLGTDPNQTSSMYNTTPLMHAVDTGTVDIVKNLINHGSVVDVKDNFGTTPLIQSIKMNKPEIAKVLIKHSRNINMRDDRGSSALHYAARQGNEHLFKDILKHGGNLRAVDGSGNNALFYAIAGRNKDIINRLINMQYFDLRHQNVSGEKAVNVAQRYGLQEIAQKLNKGRNISVVK